MVTMRLTGLNSGMDTDALISSIIETERIPIYRLEAENEFNQDKISAWSAIDSSFSTLKTNTSALTSYSAWDQMTVKTSNEAVMVATASDSAATADYAISVTKLAQAHRIGSDAQVDNSSPLGQVGTFDLGGATITLDGSENLQQIADKINDKSGEMTDQVKATIVDTTLVLERADTGATEISMTDTSGILQNLGVLDGVGAVKNEFTNAQQLTANVSGVDILRDSNNDIDDVIAGVTLNFESEGDTSLTVAKDTDSIKDKINEFVKAYNDTMQVIEEMTSVNLSSGGEGVESTGWLQGDSGLRTIQTTARRMITDSDPDLGAAFNTLRQIGISTSGEDNRISVTDTAALDDALRNNFDEVESLFRDIDNGIVRKFENQLEQWTDPGTGTVKVRQNSLRDSIADNTDRISDLERRITLYEESLYNQFARMEEAMGQMQSQQQYLSQLFSGLSGDSDDS